MFKHVIALVLLSVLAVIFKAELAVFLHWIISGHHLVLSWLSTVFSPDKIGMIAQNSLALLMIPLIIVAIVALALWIMRRKILAFLPEVMWVVWLLLLALITVS